MDAEPADITCLLHAWRSGNQNALEHLARVVQSELRQIARFYLRKEGSSQTLQPTALVNEAYVRLMQWNNGEWSDRAHFYAVAAQIMRHVLVNQAIARGRQKRGSGAILIPLEEANSASQRGADVIALDEALTTLAKFDERKSRIVELRFFGGLNADEIGEVLQISPRTVQREWDLARAWLFRELR